MPDADNEPHASDAEISNAKEAFDQGDLALAQSRFREILDKSPENFKAWHLLGIVHAQQNQLHEAAECFGRAAQLKPESSHYQYNLALAQHGLGNLDEAAQAYRNAVKNKPDFLEAQTNLGNLLIKLDRSEEALGHFRKQAERFPSDSATHFNLGNVLQDSGHFQESISHLRQAIELAPDFAAARENLGRALADTEQYDAATEVWQEWLAYDPNNSIAKHMLVSITGENVPARCDDDYVRNTFDESFASSYEQQLKQIKYCVPELISEALGNIDLDAGNQNVLDAGCGTGLCCPILRPLAKRLVGVDLSGEMLRKAENRNEYDELHERELTEFLLQVPETFDLIVSGDTFCYFGDLTAVISAAAKKLSQAGRLIFTVEAGDSDDAVKDFQLQPHGRYRHQETFVHSCLQQAGLEIESITSAALRQERGRDVIGFVVVAQHSNS